MGITVNSKPTKPEDDALIEAFIKAQGVTRVEPKKGKKTKKSG